MSIRSYHEAPTFIEWLKPSSSPPSSSSSSSSILTEQVHFSNTMSFLKLPLFYHHQQQQQRQEKDDIALETIQCLKKWKRRVLGLNPRSLRKLRWPCT
ncbi:hypothetical protein CsSME_00046666 [Camellia sinensis var. sinensis]